MATPYTTQTISGYNSSPPSDDGSQVSTNEITWDKHKTKLGDPIKTLSEAINTELLSAFGLVFGQDISTQTGTFNVVAADQGKFFSVTGTTTANLLAAATAGAQFPIVIANDGSGTVTIDPNGAETINGSATMTLGVGQAAIITCNGTAWRGVKFDLGTNNANYLNSITPGTAEASKALVLDGSKGITGITSLTSTTVTGTTVNASTTLQIGGASVTSTAAELNYNDITAAGTAQASKSLVLDGSKGITGITSLASTTITGTTINQGANNVLDDGDIGVTVQGYDAQLADVAALSPTANNFVTGDGANLVMKTPAQALDAIGIDGTGGVIVPGDLDATCGMWVELATDTTTTSGYWSDTSNLTSTYNVYKIVFWDLYCSHNGYQFSINLGTSGGYLTSGYDVATGGGSNVELDVGGNYVKLSTLGTSNVATNTMNGTIYIFNPSSTSKQKMIYINLAYWNASTFEHYQGWARNSTTSAVDRFRLGFTTSSVSMTGQFRLYGLKT